MPGAFLKSIGLVVHGFFRISLSLPGIAAGFFHHLLVGG
jgi:hypothetical protein